MKRWNLTGSTAIALFISGSASFADVTPEDVWQNWQDTSTSYGQTIKADSATRDGDTLVVTKVTNSSENNGTSVSGTIDEVRMKDMGDGTVQITMSDSYPITVNVPAVEGVEGAQPSTVTITLTAPGMTTIASGTPEATSYTVTAASIGAKVVGSESSDAAAVDMTLDATLTDVTGNYTVEGAADAKKIASDFAAKGMTFSVVGSDKTAGTDFDMKASVADMAAKSNGTMLSPEAMADMAAALKAGFAAGFNLTYGATTFDVNVTQAGSPTKITGGMTGGDMSFALDGGGFQYGSGSKGLTLKVDSAEIPIPDMSFSYGEAAFNLLMPITKSDAPVPFALMTKIVDLSVSDAIWGMIDPTAALPHDPATLVIDTKGTARLTSDITTDTAAMEAMGSTPPGELDSFDLTELHASIAGADLTGTGSLTFDNTDMASFGGFPAPTGKIDLKLLGANALIDKLVAMGLVPEDQAMQGKMMMSMFAIPGAGEDELTSSIEFKDKKMTVNGMEMPME